MSTMEAITRQTRARMNARGGERRSRRSHLDQLLAGEDGDWRQVDEADRIITRAKRLGFDDEVRELMRKPDDPQAASIVLEKIIGANNLLGVNFLFEGAAAARSVGRIRLPVAGGIRLGTGFLVTPRLMMTNNHVLETAAQAGAAELELDFYRREGGATTPVQRFRLEPDLFFVTDVPLDFSIVAVEATNSQGDSLDGRGWHALIGESGKAVVGERINIIQHPAGEPQAVAVHENQLVDVTGDFVHYETDTQGGSSGAPVFNDEWDLVALHHAAVATSNEGIRISRIVARLREILANESASVSEALASDLMASRRPLPTSPGPGPGPVVDPPAVEVNADGTASWILPIRVSVGVGDIDSIRRPRPVVASGRPGVTPPHRPVLPLPGPVPDAAEPVVIRYGEIREAFEALDSPERLLEGEGSEHDRARFLAEIGQSLSALEEAELEADPDVMRVPQDRLASLILSQLADEPPAGSSLESLEAGGLELKFASNDIGGWIKSFFQRVSKSQFHPILRPASTVPEAMPAKARFGLLSDWGTGLYGAPVIADTISRTGGFDYLFHLGDVYYSGNDKEVDRRFLQLWPRLDGVTNRALNSNHEMYSGGHAYFGKTLPSFGQASSYFALANDHWLLVGLDTGYVDHDLDDQQVRWFEDVVTAAGNRKVVLFSHHQLFSWYGSQGDDLAEKLARFLISGRIALWYWGHEHRCCLFDPDPRFGGLEARCLGHGGMPQKRKGVKKLAVDHKVGDMIWRQQAPKNLLPGGLVLDGPNEFIKGKEKKYLPHGYMSLEFDGPNLVEVVHTPRGERILERKLL